MLGLVSQDDGQMTEALAEGISGLFEAAGDALTRLLGGTTAPRTQARPVSLLNPATWDMTTTLLVVGGAALLLGGGGAARRRARRNPRRRRHRRNPFIVKGFRWGTAIPEDRVYKTMRAAEAHAELQARMYTRPPIYRISEREYADRKSSRHRRNPLGAGVYPFIRVLR